MANTRIQQLWRLDPEWGHAPWRCAPSRSERVLHIHLSTPEEPQASLCRALASLAAQGEYRRVDWTSIDASERANAASKAAAEFRPTLIFMQLQCPGVLAPAAISAMRRVANTSELIIVSWCGDVGGVNGPYPAPGDRWAFELSPECDLMLYTSLSQARAHRARGMHNAAYLQIGYDEDRYYEGPAEQLGGRFDVCFLGVNYDERRWPSLPDNDMRLRQNMAYAMVNEYGVRFGLFGRDWPKGHGHVPPVQSGEVYRQSFLALSISACSFLERYSSDRLFRALACGGATLMKSFDDWQSLGLVHEKNVLVWNSAEEGLALARAWLRLERRERLIDLGRKGACLAREHHSWGVRMQELAPMIAAMRSEVPEVNRPW